MKIKTWGETLAAMLAAAVFHAGSTDIPGGGRENEDMVKICKKVSI
jgi:hypothetical protein